MNAAVHDANVLIDPFNAGLLEVSSHLGLAFHVVDLVVAEIQSEEQRGKIDHAVSNGWLTVNELDEVGTERAVSFRFEAQTISFQDAATLALAQSLEAILLTGDRPLRSLAQRHSTETHGVLWLLDHLVQEEIIDKRAAAAALQTMRACGARLPSDECDKRLASWMT